MYFDTCYNNFLFNYLMCSQLNLGSKIVVLTSSNINFFFNYLMYSKTDQKIVMHESSWLWWKNFSPLILSFRQTETNSGGSNHKIWKTKHISKSKSNRISLTLRSFHETNSRRIMKHERLNTFQIKIKQNNHSLYEVFSIPFRQTEINSRGNNHKTWKIKHISNQNQTKYHSLYEVFILPFR